MLAGWRPPGRWEGGERLAKDLSRSRHSSPNDASPFGRGEFCNDGLWVVMWWPSLATRWQAGFGTSRGRPWWRATRLHPHHMCTLTSIGNTWNGDVWYPQGWVCSVSPSFYQQTGRQLVVPGMAAPDKVSCTPALWHAGMESSVSRTYVIVIVLWSVSL